MYRVEEELTLVVSISQGCSRIPKRTRWSQGVRCCEHFECRVEGKRRAVLGVAVLAAVSGVRPGRVVRSRRLTACIGRECARVPKLMGWLRGVGIHEHFRRRVRGQEHGAVVTAVASAAGRARARDSERKFGVNWEDWHAICSCTHSHLCGGRTKVRGKEAWSQSPAVLGIGDGFVAHEVVGGVGVEQVGDGEEGFMWVRLGNGFLAGYDPREDDDDEEEPRPRVALVVETTGGEQQAFGEGAAHFNVAMATGIQALVGGGGGARH